MEGFKKLPKMQCFKVGGSVKSKPVAKCSGGKMKEGGKADLAQDKAVVKKAFKLHDAQEHKGEKTDLSTLKKGGRTKKAVGTVKKFKTGGSVNNVYEAKKSSGDKNNIRKTKLIKPTKAAAPSGAGGPDAFKKGGKVKKYSGKDGSYVDVKNPQALTDKIATEENTADRDLIMKPVRAVGKAITKGIDAAKSAFKGQGAVSDVERSNIAKKKGGKVKKFAEGGSTGPFSAEEEAWLGGADRTDPFILARMRSALGDKKPALSAPVAAPVKSAYQAPNVEQDSGLAYPQENELRTSPMAPRRPAPMAAGPSADERLRMKNTRPYAAPNVEQDSGLDYPVKPGFFTATPGQQATSFNRGVQARKNFGKRFSFGAPSSLDTQLAAINKPKV